MHLRRGLKLHFGNSDVDLGNPAYVDGVQVPDGLARVWETQYASPGLFETMRTRVVAGRSLTWDDVATQRAVMLVSESLGRKEWGSPGGALGRRVSAFPASSGLEIVGVIEDVHHAGLDQPAPALMVEPPRAVPRAAFVVRSTRAGRADFVLDLRRAIASVSGDLSISQPRTLGAMYRHSMGRASMTLTLLGITGGLALTLGLVGVYGVVSYAVARRRREIGIRLALGARQREVVAMFVRQALVLVGIGIVIGLGAAAALTRLIASQIFGISPMDPSTHAGMAIGLVAAASLASYVSARRGAALNPVDVLKSD